MRYHLRALALLGALAAMIVTMPGQGPWLAALACLVVALPVALHLAHAAALRRAHELTILAPDGWLHRWRSGIALRLGLAGLAGLGLGCVPVVRLAGAGWPEALAIVAGALLFPACLALADRTVGQQVAADQRPRLTLWLACLMITGVMLLAYLAVLGADVAPDRPAPPVHSALLREALAVMGLWHGLEAFALGQLQSLGQWGRGAAMALTLLGNCALFFTIGTLLAFCAIPRGGLARVFRRGGRAEGPVRGPLGIAAAVGLAVVVCLFLPAVALLERHLIDSAPGDRPAALVMEQVERVGSVLVRPGTIARLDALDAAAADDRADTRAALRDALDAGFDRTEANVDTFLDWYYSLPAEYARIGHLLTGDFERYLADQLSTHLAEGAPFQAFEATMARAVEAEARLQDAAQGIVEAARLDPDWPGALLVTGEAEAPGPPAPSVSLAAADRRLRDRAVLAGAGGVAVATAVLGRRLVARGAVRTGAKAAVKVAGSRVAGSGAGGAVGGFLGGLAGSIVPGIGTGLGAAGGAALGAALVGVGADALMLELEETLHRDTFRADLIAPITEARAEMLAALDG